MKLLVNIAQAINDPDQVREIVDQLNAKEKTHRFTKSEALY